MQEPIAAQQLFVTTQAKQYQESLFQVVRHPIQLGDLPLESVSPVINIQLIEYIMQQQEYQTPFDKRHIDPFDTLPRIIPKVPQMARFEAIAWQKEEQGHVEHIDDRIPVVRKERMPQHHQHDADTLGKRHGIIKSYTIIQHS